MIQKLIDMLRRRHARANLVRNGMIAQADCPEEDRGIPSKHSRVVTCFILVLLWSISSLLLTLAQKNPQNKDIPVVGQKAPVTINADFDFRFENQAETLQAKAAARRAEPKFFAISAEANAAVRARMTRFFAAVRDYPRESGAPETALFTALPEADRFLLNGNPVKKELFLPGKHTAGNIYRIYDSRNRFIGLYQLSAGGIFRAEKLFLGGVRE